MSEPRSDDVAVCIASWNTRDLTELCVLTARARAGRPAVFVVGDGGSTDGSRPMLTDLARAGMIEFETAEGGRHHYEWLDHWVRDRDETFLVFSDSDMYYFRSGWLEDLVATAVRHDADMVMGEYLEEIPDYVDPVGGKLMRLRARPAPWLMLVRRTAIAALDTSFDYRFTDDDSVPEGMIGFDVGAAVYDALLARGGRVIVMPPRFRRTWVHFGGASWRKVGGRRARLAALLLATELPLRRRFGGSR